MLPSFYHTKGVVNDMMKNEFYFPSKDGVTKIHAIEWKPEGDVKGILQICHGMVEHMRLHADILRPKFETVLNVLESELGGLEIGSWMHPRGGYFISFDSLDGCAKAIVAKAKEAGLIMTPAGATFPYGNDPKDSNIRIAPSYPTPEELAIATDIFVLSVKLVSIDKILAEKNA